MTDAASDARPEEREVVQRGLWFEEFEPGVRYLHRPGRTVTEADNVLFTTLTMNPQPLHLDAAFAATQPFGRILVNSLFTLSTLVGQSVGQLTLGTLVANLGFGEVAFPNPVFVGDTLYGESVVESKRLSSSRPGEGVVVLAHTARNQHGVVVATASRTMLVHTREAGERSAARPGTGGDSSNGRASG
ncbi:MaoC family dehydratase [Agromyces aureus]|uniref:Dehydratase n=1 Tax=Agromyces aureus TaxID=453304 RepID=A0A191WGZ3_9MICO|nr:MaoC family dehydratase [Agromyces aureus]ANJ27454.1 dehydratase [Agromyces aureus]